ncbi:molybdopterin-binding protein, partial [Mycobacterium sp.]
MRRLGAVSARAGIVVTGTEVLTGRVQDANGPWIADRLLELGVELAHITICG